MTTKELVACGCGRYSIGFNEEGQLEISSVRLPVEIKLKLHDLSSEECLKLGKLFLKHSETRG